MVNVPLFARVSSTAPKVTWGAVADLPLAVVELPHFATVSPLDGEPARTDNDAMDAMMVDLLAVVVLLAVIWLASDGLWKL